MHQRHIALVALMLSLAACGSVETGSGEAGPDGGGGGDHRDDGDGGEPAAPTVLETTPADGAGRVLPDAEISVVFSQPMDEASVEAAWSSDDLPAVAVEFSWNAAGDTLTVAPDDPLPVAEGSVDQDDSVAALTIRFSIGADARDATGTALAEPLEVAFRTARRLSAALPYHPQLSDCRISTGSVAESPTTLYAGDSFPNKQIKLVVSFALPDAPAGGTVESATLTAIQSSATPGIYDWFGDLGLVHVRFASLSTSYGTAALGSKSTFSTSGADGPRSVAVTRSVESDVADGEDYSQFRLEFPVATNDNDDYDIAPFLRSSLTLSVVYLAE